VRSKLLTNTDAIHYKVPRRTIKAYRAENKQSKSKLGRNTVLTPQQEKELPRRIIRLAQTLTILRMCVFTYCEKNNIPNPFVKEDGMAAHAWVEGFLQCNTMIISHKVQNLNPGRAQKLNCLSVNDYFAKHKITIEKLGVMNKPHLQGARSPTAAKSLEITQLWEAIHPCRKGKLHRARSPPTTAQRSRQPSHKKTVSNTTLYAYASRNTQTVTTEHKRSDFIIAELDKMQPIQNRKQ